MRLDRAKLREAVEYTTGYTSDIHTVAMWVYNHRTEGMGWVQEKVRLLPDLAPQEIPAFIDRQLYEGFIMTYEDFETLRQSKNWSAFVLNSLWQKGTTFVANGQLDENTVEVMVWGPELERTVSYLENGPEQEEQPELTNAEELPSEAEFSEGEDVLSRVYRGLENQGFKIVHSRNTGMTNALRGVHEAVETLQTVSEYDEGMDTWQDRQVQIPPLPYKYRIEVIETVYKQVAKIATGNEFASDISDPNWEHFYEYKNPPEIRDIWEKPDGSVVTSIRGFLGKTILVWGPDREQVVDFLQNGPRPESTEQLTDQEELPSEADFEESYFHGPYENIEKLDQLGFSR